MPSAQRKEPSLWRSSYVQLNGWLSVHESRIKRNRLWRLTRRSKVTPRRIENLVAEGWRLKKRCDGNDPGACDYNSKTIYMTPALRRFARDTTLCHEVLHAIYDEVSYDGDEKPYMKWVCAQNAVIIEMCARRVRAQPDLLAACWSSFDVKPQVYDWPSLKAAERLRGRPYSRRYARRFSAVRI
jgi:hypothetical protein